MNTPKQELETKHTPTPWRYDAHRCTIVSTVAFTDYSDEPEDNQPIRVANLMGAMGGEGGDVTFIVRAANSHEALVYAVRAALDWFNKAPIAEMQAVEDAIMEHFPVQDLVDAFALAVKNNQL